MAEKVSNLNEGNLSIAPAPLRSSRYTEAADLFLIVYIILIVSALGYLYF